MVRWNTIREEFLKIAKNIPHRLSLQRSIRNIICFTNCSKFDRKCSEIFRAIPRKYSSFSVLGEII